MEVFLGITASATPHGEGNKRLKIITPQGIRQAIVKGVQKPSSKLKSVAQPFAFYEFSATKKANTFVITGASQIEDLFGVCCNHQRFCASSIMLEVTLNSFVTEDCKNEFIYLLKRLKDVIYEQYNPFICAIRYIQYIIHNCGYGYNYPKFLSNPTKPIELLSLLNNIDSLPDLKILHQINQDLVTLTLKKLIQNLENKFDCTINSKSLI